MQGSQFIDLSQACLCLAFACDSPPEQNINKYYFKQLIYTRSQTIQNRKLSKPNRTGVFGPRNRHDYAKIEWLAPLPASPILDSPTLCATSFRKKNYAE